MYVSYEKSWPKVDLHVHTSASDGNYDPDKIVRLAWEKGIRYLAITDHDTVGGIKTALAEGKKYPLEVIPGIEISTLAEESEVHILGYYIDYENPELKEFCARIKNARETRAQRIVDKLNHLGYQVSMDQVYEKAGPEVIGRPHIALALMDNGVVKSITDGFDKLLGYGKPGYVPRFKILPVTAVDIILKAGGIPVLAHPGLGFPKDMLPHLLQSGLKGIEVFHPDNSQEEKSYYLKKAKEFELIVTGGSDFHGHDKSDWKYFGHVRLEPKNLERLREESGKILCD